MVKKWTVGWNVLLKATEYDFLVVVQEFEHNVDCSVLRSVGTSTMSTRMNIKSQFCGSMWWNDIK